MAITYTTNNPAKRPLPEGAKEFKLYGGDVRMVFRPDISNGRYRITDHPHGIVDQVVRGVTSTIGDAIDKPELRTWPLNMSNQAVFGAKFDAESGEYAHDWNQALIKPEVALDDETLHEIMMEGSRQWTLRSDRGKDVGTLAHNAIEAYLRGEEPNWTPSTDSDNSEEIAMAQKALKAFQGCWEGLKDKQVLSIEQPVYSRQLRYCGTYDLLVRMNDKTYLLDIKTTNTSKGAPMGIYPEMLLQLGGYALAHKEEYGGGIDDVGIIRVGKDGRLFIVTARDLGLSVQDCERAFAFAARLHDWLGVVKPFLADARMTSHLNPVQSKVVDEPANN